MSGVAEICLELQDQLSLDVNIILFCFWGAHIKDTPTELQWEDIIEFSNSQNYPIIPCNLCGSQEHLKRKQIKSMIKEWEKKYPGRVQNIIRSISHVTPSHMADRELFDFKQSEGSSRYTWLPEGKSESAFSSKITD